VQLEVTVEMRVLKRRVSVVSSNTLIPDDFEFC
jgi:hypothetical protein